MSGGDHGQADDNGTFTLADEVTPARDRVRDAARAVADEPHSARVPADPSGGVVVSELDPVEEVARLNHDHEWRPMSLNLADAVECVCGAVREARGVGVVVSGDQLDLDAWEREADRAVAWGIVHDHPERIVALVAEVRRLRAQVVDMVPGRWWRVLDAEGDLWLETSREQEARDSMKDDPQAAALERLWVFPREAGEWRAVE